MRTRASFSASRCMKWSLETCGESLQTTVRFQRAIGTRVGVMAIVPLPFGSQWHGQANRENDQKPSNSHESHTIPAVGLHLARTHLLAVRMSFFWGINPTEGLGCSSPAPGVPPRSTRPQGTPHGLPGLFEHPPRREAGCHRCTVNWIWPL